MAFAASGFLCKFIDLFAGDGQGTSLFERMRRVESLAIVVVSRARLSGQHRRRKMQSIDVITPVRASEATFKRTGVAK